MLVRTLSADGSLPGPQQTALAAILLTHPCRTDLLLSLFVANECVTATLRATREEQELLHLS